MSTEAIDPERLLDLADAVIRELDQLQGDADAEPSLGALGGSSRGAEHFDQRGWARGGCVDLEEQCEGEGEPEYENCHWPDEGDQRDLGRGW
jgi:hypothetical protein